MLCFATKIILLATTLFNLVYSNVCTLLFDGKNRSCYETLRLHPPVARLERKCIKKYILPGTNIPINVGEIIAIPIIGIHMDPDIYPEPYKFRPERFLGEEKKNRPSHSYLAFGFGPRNCIGMRFAMISAKIAMVSLLTNFKFSVCSKTENPVTLDKDSMLLKPANGLWVKIEKI